MEMLLTGLVNPSVRSKMSLLILSKCSGILIEMLRPVLWLAGLSAATLMVFLLISTAIDGLL